ncbi:MAG: hypothetical protein KGM16_06425 [Bacteroidota bacterium]|nr:hypothetical protein [Bacteroidota bacterium]
MKKIVSIFFLAIYLFSTTQLSELLKLPLLIEHYEEHKEENKSLSFLGFLEMHYAQNIKPDADYDKDMKLPFKGTTTSNITSVSLCVPLQQYKQNPIVYNRNDKQQFPDFSFTYSSAFHSSIWQPPRSC